jgi:uncharacterized protein
VENTSAENLGTVFVDTSGFKAFYDPKDEYHARARRFTDQVATRKILMRGFITSDYVLDETLTLLLVGAGHPVAANFAQVIRESRVFNTIYVNEDRFSKSLELFAKSKDKEWSFTDCTCFWLMKEHGIRNVFTFDPHFRQAGFSPVP